MSPSSNQCRYDEGKPGKRHKDFLQLKDALFASARREKSNFFQCLIDEERGALFSGESKTRKGVSISPYIDPSDLLVRTNCSNLGCKHRKMGELRSACLLEGPYMLPQDLTCAVDLKKMGRNNESSSSLDIF